MSDAMPVRVQHHTFAIGEAVSVTRAPDLRLRGLVRGAYHGWTERTEGTHRRREVPVLMVPLILNLGPAFGVYSPGNPSGGMEDFGSFAAGVHEGHAVDETRGRSHSLQVNLTPLGARRVLGIGMHAIANRVVALEDVLGREAPLLAERLHGTASWAARFAILDEALARRAQAGPAPAPEVAWALGRIEATGGRVAIGDLAEAIGCSRKRLARRFCEDVGLGPKRLARIARFEAAVRGLAAGEDLAALALDCGYYDQAHFNREFRELAGCTPTAFLREGGQPH